MLRHVLAVLALLGGLALANSNAKDTLVAYCTRSETGLSGVQAVEVAELLYQVEFVSEKYRDIVREAAKTGENMELAIYLAGTALETYCARGMDFLTRLFSPAVWLAAVNQFIFEDLNLDDGARLAAALVAMFALGLAGLQTLVMGHTHRLGRALVTILIVALVVGPSSTARTVNNLISDVYNSASQFAARHTSEVVGDLVSSTLMLGEIVPVQTALGAVMMAHPLQVVGQEGSPRPTLKKVTSLLKGAGRKMAGFALRLSQRIFFGVLLATLAMFSVMIFAFSIVFLLAKVFWPVALAMLLLGEDSWVSKWVSQVFGATAAIVLMPVAFALVANLTVVAPAQSVLSVLQTHDYSQLAAIAKEAKNISDFKAAGVCAGLLSDPDVKDEDCTESGGLLTRLFDGARAFANRAGQLVAQAWYVFTAAIIALALSIIGLFVGATILRGYASYIGAFVGGYLLRTAGTDIFRGVGGSGWGKRDAPAFAEGRGGGGDRGGGGGGGGTVPAPKPKRDDDDFEIPFTIDESPSSGLSGGKTAPDPGAYIDEDGNLVLGPRPPEPSLTDQGDDFDTPPERKE